MNWESLALIPIFAVHCTQEKMKHSLQVFVESILEAITENIHLFELLYFLTEKEMATPSSVLAWRIPETAEPGGLLSMGSNRVGHD